MKYVLLICLVFVIGCGEDQPDKSTNKISVGSGDVKEITLSDGTKCAVGIMHGAYSYGAAGISCNWKK